MADLASFQTPCDKPQHTSKFKFISGARRKYPNPHTRSGPWSLTLVAIVQLKGSGSRSSKLGGWRRQAKPPYTVAFWICQSIAKIVWWLFFLATLEGRHLPHNFFNQAVLRHCHSCGHRISRLWGNDATTDKAQLVHTWGGHVR